jgi:hypothetical protein
MQSELSFNGSSLDKLKTINDLKYSLQLSYPELESVTAQYGVKDPRIFPYLGYKSTPLKVEKYSSRVLNLLETPIREDYVRIALNILATPIRDDYLRLVLNSLATPIREDYLRLAMNNLTRSIRDDQLRLVLQALMKAIREDCLRTALEKFNAEGIEVKSTVDQVTDVIQNNIDFRKYSPSKKFDIIGEEKIRYRELKVIGQDIGDIVTVLDRKMYEIPMEECKFDLIDYSLYTYGAIGMDGVYADKVFNMNSVEHIYLPVFCEFSPTKEKVPRNYWVGQAREQLDKRGWVVKNIKDLSRESFKTYKGKKPSNKVMSRMRYSLQIELEKKKKKN